MTAPVFLVEGEFGRGVGITCRAQRPLPIEQVQFRIDSPDIHVGLVVCVEGAHVAIVVEAITDDLDEPGVLEALLVVAVVAVGGVSRGRGGSTLGDAR